MAFTTAWRILGHAQDTEDAVQDALLDAFRMHQERPVANWGGLLRRLTTHRALDRLRKRRNRETLTPDLELPSGNQPLQSAMERELAERLRSAVAELPDREATVFSLRTFGEMSTAEAAAALGITPSAVAVALHAARRRLGRILDVESSAGRRKRGPRP